MTIERDETTDEQTTRVKRVDGVLYVQQPNGSWQRDDQPDLTDWQRVEAFTDDQIERMREEDGDDDWFDQADGTWRVVDPSKPDAAE